MNAAPVLEATVNILPNKTWCYHHRVKAVFVFYAGDCGCSRCSLGAILSPGETPEQLRGLEKGHQSLRQL